ncbi:MAG: kelch repeat-containing protein [Halobacteriales archaeon]|nr:kelch repeat-containing protein [Halobacteriales archaeon]
MPDRNKTFTRRRLLYAGGGVAALGVGVGWWLTRSPSVKESEGWSEVASMPAPRGEMKGAELDGEVYVPGGLVGRGSSTDRLEKYDTDADEWTELEPMPEPRNHHATVAVDNRIFVLGGNDDFGDPPQDDVFAYDPDADGWEERAPMPDGRWGNDAVEYEGRIYVVGGDYRDGPLDVLVYNPEDDEWERSATIPTETEHTAVEAYNGEIWTVSGRWDFENIRDVSVYDPEGDEWREGTPVSMARSGAASAVLEDELHVAGGENPDTSNGWVTDTHEVYDSEGEWRDAPPMPLPLHGCASVEHGGRMYVVGGAWRHGLQSVTAWSDRVFVFEPS